MKLKVANLGRIDYAEALRIQEILLESRCTGSIGDVLLLLEHPPVLTVGRRGSDSNILIPREVLKSQGVGVFDISRGGDVTYHGPGQIVGYPIFDLNNHGKNIKDFVWKIEEVFIRLLEDIYGINAQRDEKKYTGVWVGNEKITAIGIAVKHWVTMHGFAFNVNTNLEHFKWIVPCGITDKGVTSLEKILGSPQDFEYLCKQIVKYFEEIFRMDIETISNKQLYQMIGSDVYGE